MIDPSDIASELAAAQRERRHRQPFTDEFPELDLETAYAVQWAGAQARLDAGELLIGAKLGLTSKAKQRVMNVAAPLYGFVTRGMMAPYEESVELASFIHPRVEPELAFLLARDAPAPATVTTVQVVLDFRYENFRFTLPVVVVIVVADNTSASAPCRTPGRTAHRLGRSAPARLCARGRRGRRHRGRCGGAGSPGGLGRLARQPARQAQAAPVGQLTDLLRWTHGAGPAQGPSGREHGDRRARHDRGPHAMRPRPSSSEPREPRGRRLP